MLIFLLQIDALKSQEWWGGRFFLECSFLVLAKQMNIILYT